MSVEAKDGKPGALNLNSEIKRAASHYGKLGGRVLSEGKRMVTQLQSQPESILISRSELTVHFVIAP
jgi:hypothetical protein